MAGKPVEIVVLKDSQGNYYLLPREALERMIVPEEYRDEVEALAQEGSVSEDENEELSMEQLEAVTGGLSGYGTFDAPSQLSFDGFMSNWSSSR